MKTNKFICITFLLGTAIFLAGCETTQGEQAGAKLGEVIGRTLSGAPAQPKAASASPIASTQQQPKATPYSSSVPTTVKTVATPESAVAAAKPPAVPAMNYANMITVIGASKGDEATAKRNLVGKPIQVTLKVVRQLFVVDAKDEIIFNCAKKAPGFKGGKVTSVISNYVEQGDSTIVFLDRCQ